MMETNTYKNLLDSVPLDLKPLIPGYLQRRETEIRQLFYMLEAQDFTAIKEIAHRLKGSGTGYGLSIYTELATELEKAAFQENHHDIKRIVDQIESATWTIKQSLQDIEAA
jgi:HPt (histidine-containing phosphotransfer) domain-containing protein